MSTKSIIYLLLLATLGFISIGDLILPRPLSTYSRHSREQINNFFLSVMPKPHPTRPSKQREAETEEFLRRAQPSPNH